MMQPTRATSLTAVARRLVVGLPLLAVALWTSPAQAQNYIYYTETTQNYIGRADLSGTAPLTPTDQFINTGNGPFGVAVDSSSIYWSNQTDQTLGISDLAGGTVNNTWIDATNGVALAAAPGSIALDGGYIYWVDLGDGWICRAPINNVLAAEVPWVTLAGGAKPFGLTAYNGQIFWTEQHDGTTGTGTVGYAPATYPGTGSVNESLVSGLNGPTGICANSQFLFVGSNNDGTVSQHNLDGTASVSLNFPYTTGETNLLAITLGTSVYWGGNDLGTFNLAGTGVVTDPFVTTATGPFYGVTITNAPTVITLTAFQAKAQNGGVGVTWTTGSEVDTVGFNIWRSGSFSGTYTKLNASIIAAQGTGEGGASYSFTDATATPGTYYYKLEDLDTHGVATYHGPASAVVGTPSPITSFQATPADIFKGGGTFLTWSATGAPALTLSGTAVTGSSLWVAPTATTSYTLADAQGDQSLLTVVVKPFSLIDMPGLSLAWGSARGDANYNAAYDLNGDGKVDDADVALLFAGL